MFNLHTTFSITVFQARNAAKNKQHGVVLFFALIALVAMSLAAVALIRSVDTNSLIAGNLSFKQSSILSADRGVETAIAWVKGRSQNSLKLNAPANGYYALSTADAKTLVAVSYTHLDVYKRQQYYQAHQQQPHHLPSLIWIIRYCQQLMTESYVSRLVREVLAACVIPIQGYLLLTHADVSEGILIDEC